LYQSKIAEQMSRQDHQQRQRWIGISKQQPAVGKRARSIHASGVGIRIGERHRIGIMPVQQCRGRFLLKYRHVHLRHRHDMQHPQTQQKMNAKQAKQCSP